MNGLKYVPFYLDWYEMMKTKDTPEKQVAFVDAIFDYALERIIPPSPRELESPKGTDYARRDGYLLSRSTLDFILPKIMAGAIGGKSGTGSSKARVGNQNASKERKQNASKERKQNASKTQAANASLSLIKDKDKDKDKESVPITRACARESEQEISPYTPIMGDPILPTPKEQKLYAKQVNVPESYLPVFIAQMRDIGWEYVNRGAEVVRLSRRNFKALLKSFYVQDLKNKRDEQRKSSKIDYSRPVNIQPTEGGVENVF